jgi:L-ascorbate metabolism protein UlaG (beta-lactamase superfamily)
VGCLAASCALLLAFTRPQEPAAKPAPEVAQASELEVFYLANEGFLLRAGGKSVLIDAFVAEPHGQYSALPAEVAQQLTAAHPPFESVDIALTSHAHRDHFQAEPACAFMASSPATLFATSPEVIEGLHEQCENVETEAHYPAAGASEVLDHAGIQIEFLHLSHGTSQNMGHVITLGGRKVLHVGDADMKSTQFAAFDLPGRKLDLAFIPYWYFESATGRDLIAKYCVADVLVASHIPKNAMEGLVKLLTKEAPEVVIFHESMESRLFPVKLRSSK